MKIKTLLVLCFLVVMVLSCNNVVEDVTAPIQNGDSFTVPAEELLSFVRTLPAGNYTIKITGKLTDIYDLDYVVESWLINSVPEGVFLSFDLTDLYASKADHWREAFKDCTFLTSVILPDYNPYEDTFVWTFAGCTNLKSVTVPQGFRDISSFMFEGCTSLTSITIPDGVTSIEGGAFSDCTSLTSITIPDSVTSI